MTRSALLRLAGPLAAWGDVAVDHHRPTNALPTLSALVGLIGAALGYDRADANALAGLQSRFIYAARADRPGSPLLDFQTARLRRNDVGWTTRGELFKRAGGAQTYKNPHIRFRHYIADGAWTVALQLSSGSPDVDAVAVALMHPARPLYLGRRSCSPSSRILLHVVDAPDVLTALRSTSPAPGAVETMPACWPLGLDEESSASVVTVTDIRDWQAGWHAGQRQQVEGMLRVSGGV